MTNILKKVEKSIPLTWYYDADHFNKEMMKIWSIDWIYACHINQLKDPLSFITLNIAKFNVIILRDKNDSLVSYLNTCQHRGSILCNEPKGTLKKNMLVCPYHQWSYDASDGKLIKTSSFQIPKDFDKADYGLKKVEIKVWNGLIFVNFSQKEVEWDTQNRFQDYDPAINQIELEKFEVGHIWKKVINCNWKIFWENYSECLHCPNIHPELSDLVPVYGRRLMDIKEDPDWGKKSEINHPKFQGGLRENAETWSTDGSTQGKMIQKLKDIDSFQGHIYLTAWPSMFIAVFADHVRVVRILPINNEQTEVSAEWIFEASTNRDEHYDKKNVVDFAILVMSQDGDACELNQKGVYNPSLESGVLMPEEYEVKKFHDWVKTKISE